MGDNQFQTQQTYDVANETVAQQVDSQNLASQLHKNNVHIMKKGEQTYKEKIEIVKINREERQKGKNFMKRVNNDGPLNFRNRKEQRKIWLTMQNGSKRKVQDQVEVPIYKPKRTQTRLLK